MFHPNQIRTGEALALIVPSRTGACLIDGCTCKDARIVSHRRAAFFAAVARMADGLASTDTITWGGDNSRAGYQT